MYTKEGLLNRLAPFGQEQLLTFWEELNPEERENLGRQIDAIDLDEVKTLFARRNGEPASSELLDRIEEPVSFLLSGWRESLDPPSTVVSGGSSFSPAQAIEAGEAALRAGRLAVSVVAGGQGTRLDFPHAKGIFPIGPVSGVSLFQIHIERIRAMSKKYGGVRIPFCIQTSPATHQETIDYFRENKNFGLRDDDVLIFCQGTMPSVDWDTGKILLSEKGQIARSPDGHGGFLASINAPQADSPIDRVVREGILSELQSRGIDEIFYFQIDNPVIDICSAEFIGYHLLSKSEFSSQVVHKQEPLERVGNMVLVDGRLHVIEYSDLPESYARLRKPDGTLKIWAGSIAVHMLNIPFLRKKVAYSGSMPFHTAKKKVPYIVLDHEAKDENGEPMFGKKFKPDFTNAIKFEKFIFDLLPQANNPIVIEIDEKTCFAPLKNHPREKKDTPKTVREGLCGLYEKWLAALGITVAPGVQVEISPLFANNVKELGERLRELKMIPESKVITESVYWHLPEEKAE